MERNLNGAFKKHKRKLIRRYVLVGVIVLVVFLSISLDLHTQCAIRNQREMYATDSPEYYLMTQQLNDFDLAKKQSYYKQTEHFLVGCFTGIGHESEIIYRIAAKTESGYRTVGAFSLTTSDAEYILMIELYADIRLEHYLAVVRPMPIPALTTEQQLFLDDMQIWDSNRNVFHKFEASGEDKGIHYLEYTEDPSGLFLFAATNPDAASPEQIGRISYPPEKAQ